MTIVTIHTLEDFLACGMGAPEVGDAGGSGGRIGPCGAGGTPAGDGGRSGEDPPILCVGEKLDPEDPPRGDAGAGVGFVGRGAGGTPAGAGVYGLGWVPPVCCSEATSDDMVRIVAP